MLDSDDFDFLERKFEQKYEVTEPKVLGEGTYGKAFDKNFEILWVMGLQGCEQAEQPGQKDIKQHAITSSLSFVVQKGCLLMALMARIRADDLESEGSGSIFEDEGEVEEALEDKKAALMQMGFDPAAVADALAHAAGDTTRAIDLLMAQAPSEVTQLIDMGYPEDAARDALERTNSLEEAADLLISEALGQSAARRHASASRSRSRSRSREEAREASPEEAPVTAPNRPRKNLEIFADKVKATVIDALAGPECKRKSQVLKSIKRGRISQWQHHWQKDPSEERMESFSPGYAKLKGYQRVGVRWLLALARLGHGGILADEMGLGKTAQALVFIDILVKQQAARSRTPAVAPSLVFLAVVPMAVLETWERECALWCPHFKTFRYHHGQMKERWALASRFCEEIKLNGLGDSPRLVLTTASILGNKEDQCNFFKQLTFECIICDEAHAYRNAGTQTFKHVDRIRAKRRVLLTGTPVHNSLQELGNLLKLVLQISRDKCNPKLVKIGRELDGIVERQSLRTLQVRAAPFMMRRLKKDVMQDLPEKSCKAQRCPLTEMQQELYDAEIERAKVGSKKLKKREARKFLQNLLFRLRRLCNHPLLTCARFSQAELETITEALRTVRSDFAQASKERCLQCVKGMDDYELVNQVKTHQLQGKLAAMGVEARKFQITREDLMNSAKLKELLQILQGQRAAKQKTLVFSQFTMYLDIIETALNLHEIRYARLDGTCKLEDRQSSIDLFQKEGSGVDVFLLSMKAGGTGLNLTAANRVVLMDLSWNPQDNRQAEDRAHRLGQQQPVTVTYLTTADTIEEKIVKCNVAKMELDYKFGGQKSALDTSAFDESESSEGEKKKKADKEAEAEACDELGQELGLL
ncbi:SWI/SNF-related matrix-associated actin-dependent regulator of chromatin subfamily A containing DEAD/H box 1B [Durusdinium trenchii]|uniref:SWI/SNF-related matrix-associated actin-dependent regulator of chromatin subfamily A containing DEAD/H box 1B n=1 Tax=Durusdinium trenchii TaxID=1381693 RepID=A0ABP0JEF0_9DINO